jgi:hypothetical protein
MFKDGSLFLLLPIGNRRIVRLNACGSNTERIKMNKEKSLQERMKEALMKRRIKHNDLLTAWFLEDHATLPASYVKSCQEFFDEISKRQASSDKPQASSDKLPHIQTTK